MMKKLASITAALSLTLVLAACGQQLKPTKTSYGQKGLVAVVKGDASGSDHVKYSTGDTKGESKINGGTFAITLPVTDKQQNVKLSVGSKKETVKIKSATALGNYKDSASKYNQAVIGMALPASVQKQAKSAQTMTKAKLAALPMAQRVAAMKQLQTVQAAMAKAKTATKDSQLPASADEGITQVLKAGKVKVRANVTKSGKLMGYAVIVPVKSMKNKTEAKQFGITLGLLGNSVGADTQKVMKKFSSETKGQSKSQTTIKTITSNGVKFDIGFSTTDLYIYITK
ncbi:MAG: hypothetical protein LKG24_07240 [Lacticaseibacillus songhuajiangensis]|jgi:hypothetical protein|nr:hypothetical protein [Lacticaseibacillus songhuajiangensis]